MPRYDGTGPGGGGPKTGRKMGRCATATEFSRGRGMGQGRAGKGMRRGTGRCMGRHRSCQMGHAPMQTYVPEPENEQRHLEEFAEQLKADLESIEERIRELKESEETEE